MKGTFSGSYETKPKNRQDMFRIISILTDKGYTLTYKGTYSKFFTRERLQVRVIVI